jgi:hypothetical protein
MLNAWGDIDGLDAHGFVTNPPNKAFALFWCLRLHHACEFRALWLIFSPFGHFWSPNIKYQCVSFMQLL